MPCYDPPRNGDWGQGWDAQTQEHKQEHRIAGLEARISKLTNMLCAVCSRIDEKILTHELMDVGNWWFEHKAFDKSREESERRRKEHEIQYKKRMMADLKKEIEELEKT